MEQAVQTVVDTIIKSQDQFQKSVCEILRQNQEVLKANQEENRKDHTRLHERMDQIMDKETVLARDCETRRTSCKACLRTEIKAVQVTAEEKQQIKTVNTQMNLGNYIQLGILVIGIVAIWLKVG